MTPSEKAARLVFPGFKCGIDDPADAEAWVELGAGGFCLYGGTRAEVSALTARLQAKAAFPLLISADYEDGTASQCPDGTPLPSNMGIAASGDEALARRKGRLTAAEARAMGVSWVLAPVVDLATAPANPIVNTRAFSDDPASAARFARAYLQGLQSAGALGCLKHFPGHGETSLDSHLELPTVPVSRELLGARELRPYRELLAEAGAVMTGHLLVPALEPERVPYSLSADGLRTLRGELGFAGLVSTDALSMGAVAGGFAELDACERALRGGADILLVPRAPRELLRALPALIDEKPELAPLVLAAHARLEAALKGVGAPAPAAPSPEDAAAEAQALADACLAWAGAPRRLPKAVRYWEPDCGQDEWMGAEFVEALKSSGISVKPWDEGAAPDEALVAGSFLSPRAYAGRIRYDGDEAARVKKTLARHKDSRLVSFGSPFVFPELGVDGLCAFSFNAPAQRAAARALCGALEVRGRMPVSLKTPVGRA